MTRFVIRRMTMADKPAMLDICSRIWEGTDYLPAVFDQWAADTEGEFAAALLDGKLVGCGKLTFLTPRDAWLEGLRKDPLVQEKGLGEAVAGYFLGRLAARPGLASVRFSTYIGNKKSIAANEKTGFRRRTTLSVKAREGTSGDLDALAPTPPRPDARVEVIRDADQVLSFLRRTGYFASLEGLVVEGWRVWPWSEQLLVERYVKPGLCRGAAGPGGLRALSIVVIAGMPSADGTRRTMVRLVCLDALDDAAAAAMMDDVMAETRSAVERTGAARWEIEWMIPHAPRLARWASRGGLQSWEQEDDFLVYELPLDQLRLFSPG